MDEFAQTRGADDLFDDDFTPTVEPTTQPRDAQAQLHQRGGRNVSIPRRKGNRSTSNTTRPPLAPSESSAVPTQSSQSIQDPVSRSEEDIAAPSQQQPPSPPQKQSAAVLGDRARTGGITKPKLTEDELSARLASARLNNAKRAEAHRLAEADEASFQQREAQASQKRKEEGAARRAMIAERERNRLRKLGQQAGREWDEGKQEQEAGQGPQHRKGSYGGMAYDGGRSKISRNEREGGAHISKHEGGRSGFGPRGHGRGDRGRGGRGRGEYHHSGQTQGMNIAQKAPDRESDFPALPTASKKEQFSQVQPLKQVEQPLSPVVAGGNWADEVQESKGPSGG